MVSKFNKQRPVRRFRLEGHLIDRRFRRHWRNYIIQCGLAALALLIVLLVVDVVLQAAIVVAIASTAFIVFVAPHSMASTPRRVIGGHVVALIVGTAFSLLYLMPGFGEHIVGSHFAADVIAVFSVGLSILLMVMTNTEHPPRRRHGPWTGDRRVGPVGGPVRAVGSVHPCSRAQAPAPAPD